MESLMITGYSSNIAKELVCLVEEERSDIKIIKCGRDEKADVKVDFSFFPSILQFIQELKHIHPRYLFLNHGVLPGKLVNDIDERTINNSLYVNLLSVMMILESLVKIENLNTVVMSSISGKIGSYDTLYAACKAGCDVVVKRCAISLPSSSRLNAVSPGIIEDARMTMVRKDLDVLASKRKQTPTKKFTTAKEVAGMVKYLLFESENMQGENININGGLYIS